MKKTGTKKTLMRLAGFSKKYAALFALTIVCAVIYVAASLLIPVFVGETIDFAIEAGRVDFESIFALLLKIGIATGAAAAAQYIMNLSNNRIAAKTVCSKQKTSVFQQFSRSDRIIIS